MKPRRLKGALTLRITEADVVESQLSVEDLRAITEDGGDGDGDGDGGVKCPNVYCKGGYQGPAAQVARER
jgi:hypothetical protein